MKPMSAFAFASLSSLLACGSVSQPEVTAWYETHVDERARLSFQLFGNVVVDDGKLVELEVHLLRDTDHDGTELKVWAQPLGDLGSDRQELGAVFEHQLTTCGRHKLVTIVRDDAGGEGFGDPYSFSVPCEGREVCAPRTDRAYTPTADAAVAIAGSCTTEELAAFESAWSDDEAGYLAARASVDGACAACIFTDLPASTLDVPEWAAIAVVREGAERGYGLVNQGWCVANTLSSPHCGALLHASTGCFERVCAHCAESQREECEWPVECSSMVNATWAACPADAATAMNRCDSLDTVGQIRTLCGPPTP